MSSSKKPFRALSSLIVVRVFNALMQFGSLALIARSVSLADFGGYSASVALGAVTGGFLGFGLSTRVLRIQSESSRDMLLPATRVTAISALLVGAISYTYGIIQGSDPSAWALASGTYVASELFCNLMTQMLFGEQRKRRAEIGMIAVRGLPFALISASTLWWPSAVFEAAALGYVLAAAVLRLLVGPLPWRGWRFASLVSGSWQYWWTTIWGTLQQLDVVIVTSFLGLSAAGGYGAAFRLASPVHIVTSSITSLMIPELSRLPTAKDRTKAARPFLRVGLIYAGLVVALAPAAAWIGPWLFGAAYVPFALLFAILFINSAISVVNQIQVARLYGDGQVAVVTTATCIATVTGLLALALGAAVGGVMWAAVGFASSRLLLLLLLGIQSRRHLGGGPNSLEGSPE